MTLAPDSFKGTPVEGFIFRHKQWVVTKDFAHVLPIIVADPANATDVEAAMFPYPSIEMLLTVAQHAQWMEVIRDHPGGDGWFSVCETDNSLVFLGKFSALHEAQAEHFKQASPLNLYSRALIRQPTAHAWTYLA